MNNKEKELAAMFLSACSEMLSNRMSNDFDFPSNWSEKEKTEFTKGYHDWNGDPEEYLQGMVINNDSCVVNYLSALMVKELLCE